MTDLDGRPYYDSPEVKGAVWADMIIAMTQQGAMRGASRLEWNTLHEGWGAYYETYIAPVERFCLAMDEFMARIKEFTARIAEWFESVAAAIFDGLRAAILPAIDLFKELADLLWDDEPEPKPWQRRPRKPDVRPLHLVDNVRAGRRMTYHQARRR